MNASLLLLSKLRVRGQLRQLKRTVSSPKGIVLAVVTLGFFAMALVPVIVTRRTPAEAIPLIDRFLNPALFFALWVFTVVGSSYKSPIAFSMSEVDFLFPGPYTRRQLLIYKLLASVVGTLGFAVLMCLFLPGAWWPAALLGVWVLGIFLQWSAVLTALAVEWLGTRFRTLLWAAAVVLLVAAVASLQQAGVFAAGLGFRERLAALESSWAARVVLAPFVVFGRLIAARTAAGLGEWLAAALTMIVAVAAAILKLDANFLEASLTASRRRYEVLERMKRTGGLPTIGARSTPRFSLPAFPRMWGAGPIAWRQMLQMLRGSGRLLFVAPALIAPVAMLVIIANQRDQAPSTGIVIMITLLISFFISAIMPLGLRTDLDHVDAIKSLPIKPAAIVWGSIGSAILYITWVQLIATGAIAIALGRWTPAASLAMGLALPVNLLLVAADSILVLLFPAIRRLNPHDLLAGARVMLVNMAKVAFALVAAGIALSGVMLAGLATDSRAVMATAGCAVMTLEGLAAVWVAARLFARYDVSAHVAEGE